MTFSVILCFLTCHFDIHGTGHYLEEASCTYPESLCIHFLDLALLSNPSRWSIGIGSAWQKIVVSIHADIIATLLVPPCFVSSPLPHIRYQWQRHRLSAAGWVQYRRKKSVFERRSVSVSADWSSSCILILLSAIKGNHRAPTHYTWSCTYTLPNNVVIWSLGRY